MELLYFLKIDLKKMDYSIFIDILNYDSTSSKERALAEHLATALATPHCSVETMEVGDGTLNLLFSWGTPQLVFCTHIDTVPPYIPRPRHLRRKGSDMVALSGLPRT